MVYLASRNTIMSMVYLTLLILSLASCAGNGSEGPINSTSPTAQAGNGGDQDPVIAMTSTPTGVTAHLTWDHPPDFNAAGYTIYYGKHSPEAPNAGELVSQEPSSCALGEKLTVEDQQATITGLEPNTEYFFAIRALTKNEAESLCSNEITAVTPLAQS